MTPFYGVRHVPREGRVLLWGAACALAISVAGRLVVGLWLGWTDDDLRRRLEDRVRALVAERLLTVEHAAVAASREVEGLLRAEAIDRALLFDAVDRAATRSSAGDVALTVYAPGGAPLAWRGRSGDHPPEQLEGPAGPFVTPPPRSRLNYLRPVLGADSQATDEPPRRLGTVVAERPLGTASDQPQLEDVFFGLAAIPVLLRPAGSGAGVSPGDVTFLIDSPTGQPWLEARVAGTDLRGAREHAAGWVRAAALGTLAATLLAFVGAVEIRRARLDRPRPYFATTAVMLIGLLVARGLLWLGAPAARPSISALSPEGFQDGRLLYSRHPVDFLVTATLLALLVVVWVDPVRRARLLRRPFRRAWRTGWGVAACAGLQVGAGALVGGLLLAFQMLLSALVERTPFSVLHVSLHPWNGGRLAVVSGVLLVHAATMWTGILALRAAVAVCVLRHSSRAVGALVISAWLVPTTIAAASSWSALPTGVHWPVAATAAACAAIAWTTRNGLRAYRHGSQALRLGLVFLALWVPALLLYPSLAFHADAARRRLVEEQFAVQVREHPEDLQRRLRQSLDLIDEQVPLLRILEGLGARRANSRTDSAFDIWVQTPLAEYRLTSALELYDETGALISRFALNFPEYSSSTQGWIAGSCSWDVIGEASPFGSGERRMLRAARGVCEGDATGETPTVVGGIVVRVMLDYNALPFIAANDPSYGFVGGPGPIPREDEPASEVDLVVYGWGRTPVYSSAGRAWPLGDPLFARIYRSRDPFWSLERVGDEWRRVHFSNDRAGIYAISYPDLTLFRHLVHVAEITVLAGLTFVLLLGAGRLLASASGVHSAPGRRLISEVRTSFYRKLFLAFVLASVVPVLVLAVLIRAYVADQLRADIEAEAARTAGVAQRFIEEFLALQGADSVALLDDDVLVWIGQVIEQGVNIYDEVRLVATSERDLFASGVLSTRTPADVHRALVLQRLPSYVGANEVGGFRYLVAAAPVRLPPRDRFLTVPLALRQREIEREIDELDRGVTLGALVFILAGGAIGFWMAERIADPVQRLTRASRRIAGGDLDARVLVRSADELQRLVASFNSMAEELKHQQQQLERTHRLEAWAEMARQVAHDIKNPLTPIQLSAEHLRRVNVDRDRPLSPVLEGCIDTILAQVHLLRQIASEFSSFASSPTPHPEPTDVRDLAGQVLAAYEVGLAGRVRLAFEAPSDLPPARVDRMLLQRAMTNIIENALHAMPGGGELTVTLTAGDGALRIDLADTGIGMDAEAVERLFEPYFSTKATGTGLGLTIAKRNVELQGGRIAVTSAKHVGTTVTIWVPIESDGRASGPGPAPPATPPGTDQPRGRTRAIASPTSPDTR